MKSSFSKIISFVAGALMLVTVLVAFAACGPKEPTDPVTYTVNVVDEAGIGIKGAVVNFKIGNASPQQKATNVAGVATLTVPPEKLSEGITAEVKELPLGYSTSGGYVEFGEKTSLTFTAVKTYKYTVNVISDGDGVEAARVRLFVGEEELEATFTDRNGVIEFYIPSTSETVSAKLTLPQGYELSGESTLVFGSDRTVTFSLRALTKYHISTLDLFKRVVPNVTVKVYRASDDVLVYDGKIGSLGYVEFYSAKDDYYVVPETVNPAIVLTADADEHGVKRVDISKNETSKILYYSYTEEPIEYTVNVKAPTGEAAGGVTVNLFSALHDYVTCAVSDADGVVKFKVPNGSYIAVAEGNYDRSAAPVSFYENGAVVGEISLTDGYLGSNANDPAQLLDNALNIAHIPSGSSAYFYIPNAINRSVKISADGIKVVYKGNEYVSSNGAVSFSLDGDGEALIEIINENQSNVKLTVEVNKRGSANNPIELSVGSDISIKLMRDEVVYYTFTAAGNKTLIISFDGSYSDLATVLIDGKEVSSLAIKSGEQVTVVFGASRYEEGMVSYTVLAQFEERRIDYSVNVQLENSDSLTGIILELYRDGAPTGITAVTDAEGNAVFENVHEYPGYSVVVKNIPEGYEVINKNITFDEDKAGVLITLIPDGSLDSPFDVVIGEAEEYTFSDTIWLEINIRGVSEYVLNILSENSTISIYDDKNGEAILTFNDVSGMTYVFNEAGNDEALDEGVYYVKVESEGGFAAVSSAAAGYSAELPQKLGEAGEYVSTVKEDGGLVYYEYVGALMAGDELTVTVGEGAQLLVNGEVDTDGTYTFIYDGSDVLFAISAALAENYDFEITVD